MNNRSREKIKKTKEELREDVRTQVRLLVLYSELYDGGELAAALPMSTAIKNLFYAGRNAFSPLLELGVRGAMKYLSSGPVLSPNPNSPQCQLAGIHVIIEKPEAFYVPTLSSSLQYARWVKFDTWWTDPVLRDTRGHTYSRLQLIQEVRDTDGGSHIDGSLNEVYLGFKTGRYTGWSMRKGELISHAANPFPACIRQITHEVLISLQKSHSELVSVKYEFPGDPFILSTGASFYLCEWGIDPVTRRITGVHFEDSGVELFAD